MTVGMLWFSEENRSSLRALELLRQAPPLSAQAMRQHDARDKLFYQSSEANLGVLFDIERNKRSLVAAAPPPLAVL